ncbi:hypothetical protein SLE2022_220780 [Rubroshorea leprosula]
MGKRGKSQKKDMRNPKRRHRDDVIHPEDMDDEIDTFHKQRDIIPLDINGDVEDSDEDNEHPVFDLQGINDGEHDDDEEEDEDDDDAHISGFAAKLARQQKYLRAKYGGVEDEMHDEEDEDEKDKKALWGGLKSDYYHGDNRNFELQSSDDESPAEEEEEVLRMQREKAKYLSTEDFVPEDISENESEKEPTFEEISAKGKGRKKSQAIDKPVDGEVTTFEKVKKDLNALSNEEQMDVVYSSAPELVGLLSELNVALEELENKVNPLLRKAKEGGPSLEGGMRYLEVKQLLLLAYCQVITFYLLLKSEGQPVRDHPVLSRIVEIQGLLDKMKQLDGNLPSELEEILTKNYGAEKGPKLVKEKAGPLSFTKDHVPSPATAAPEAKLQEITNFGKVESTRDQDNKVEKPKHQNDQISVQSKEMLKIRAALAEKLKQKGVLNSITSKPDKAKRHVKPLNGQLETHDDFGDDAMNVEQGSNNLSNGQDSSLYPAKLSQLVTVKQKKAKVVSGDDDLPKRDDIGERRRKHELKVLAGAGIKSEGDAEDELGTLQEDGDTDVEDGDTEDSEDDLYEQVRQQRAAKLAAKAEMYSRNSATPSLPETVDGKRQITYQMEKNRGLTRRRKKLTKNPRKKYRVQHEQAVKRRKGQVRDIRKPTGQYGGEATGINAGISRSTRFKN